MTWAQAATAASQNPEPLVVGALAAGAGVVILWFAQKVLWLVKQMQSLMIAIFGDANNPMPNGAIRKLREIDEKVGEHGTAFAKHCEAEEAWQKGIGDSLNAQNNRFHERFNKIEERLPMKQNKRRATE